MVMHQVWIAVSSQTMLFESPVSIPQAIKCVDSPLLSGWDGYLNEENFWCARDEQNFCTTFKNVNIQNG